MADTLGAACKLCRREGTKLYLKGERCFTPKCAVDPNRRPYPPGPQHQQQRRRKTSEYGVQLREKQRARHIYGVRERQFRRHFAEAERLPGAKGENLLRVLEGRLDNAVYRLGFAESRAQARQLVTHGHFTVKGRRVDIPSAAISSGDVIAVGKGSRELEYFKLLAPELGRRTVPAWLSLDPQAMAGRVLRLPSRQDIDSAVQEQLIVEFYSR
ncbi:MAG: 30S ribosomal protein S4 [Deltaproteobacteria bacterium]|nr:30S ribosomal protein S4 [Deltaproteobacteria bacterium]